MTTRNTSRTVSGVTIRKITWAEFYQIRPDLRSANDNRKERANAA
jgi:hypothetical protein